jgi:hypothetical protein
MSMRVEPWWPPWNLANLSWRHSEGINAIGTGACRKRAVLLFLLQDHAVYLGL